MRTLLKCSSMCVLLWVIAAHLTGPSDLWEKDQSKTMSYTTDIIENGRWVLPTEMGGAYATKPPLYNWFAVPFVRAFGTFNEQAHRAPSILALIALWALLVFSGRFIDGKGGIIGWLAGLAFLANPAMFKLGFLARPDMLLTLWLVLGWMLATHLIVAHPALRASQRVILQIAFWLCIALASLTKGPPALVLIIYAVVAPRILSGRWSASIVGLWWGIPLAIAPFAIWLYFAWSLDPDHLVSKLWQEEVLGRVTGLGDEGNRRGPIEFLYRIAHMPFYYIMRFAPWSVLSILAMIELWSDRKRAEPILSDATREWLLGAAVMLLIIIAFFSLSTGKRAAYIAAAYGPGALLAAWWLRRFLLTQKPIAAWIVALFAAVMLSILTVEARLDRKAPVHRFGDQIRSFFVESAERIDKETFGTQRDPILLWEFDYLLLRALVGGPYLEDAEDLIAHVKSGGNAWCFSLSDGSDIESISGFIDLLEQHVQIDPVLTSAELPESPHWPGRMTLWRISSQ